jgi:hypothetical protein
MICAFVFTECTAASPLLVFVSVQCIRRGAFFSVEDLKQAIREFLNAWNENPKPFVWTATVESIMEKLSRCRQTLEKIQPGCTLPGRRKHGNTVV